MTFAYLITAHEDTKVLRILLKSLDNPNCDIFIHWDKKSLCPSGLNSILKYSKLYLVENPVKVDWGSYTQVQAEMKLFRTAFIHGPYDYYHLISASDMPIKCYNEMKSFFKHNKGKEFIAFNKDVLESRIKYYHLFVCQQRNMPRWKLYSDKIFVGMQRVFFRQGRKVLRNFSIYKGANWCSVTNDFVRCLMDNEKFVMQISMFAKIPDEHYKQIVAMNFGFADRIFNLEDEHLGCMRYVDWERGSPYNWLESDFEEIIKSGRMFCRKISSEKLANKILEYILLDNKEV